MRNNDEIIELLEKLKDEKGLSISEIARRVGMAKSAVARYFNRTREFPLNRVNDFAKAFGVEPEYLLGVYPDNVKSVSSVVKIPILGKIACGDPIDAIENVEAYKTRPSEDLPQGELFYLEANGDSMYPLIPNGSLVLCRKQEDVENGEIAAVLVNGDEEATLKKIRKVNDMVILEPINDKYDPYIITESNPARIVGKALEVVSAL